MKHIFLVLITLIQVLCGNAAQQKCVTVSITNPAKGLRSSGEIVEISMSELSKRLGTSECSLIVTDQEGNEVPSQMTYDGKLIFQIGAITPKGTHIYNVREGAPASYVSKVYGRQYKERQEDFSFENDRIGYRLYGPETQNKKKERLYGYDIFNKRTEELILDELYADQTDSRMWATFDRLNKKGRKHLADSLYMAFCYHIDHGKGMDCYKVGPTLGAGTNALLNPQDGSIVYPWCYASYEILDNGPLRLTVKFDYGNRKLEGKDIHETRILTIDAGSNMVKADVIYEGLPHDKNIDACAGIVVHDENPDGYRLNKEKRYMAYEDLGDVNVAWPGFRETQAKEMGSIFIGTVFPCQISKCEFRESDISGAKGHVMTILPCPKSGRFTYYFGSGWNRNPVTNINSLDDWEKYLSDFSANLNNPLKVNLK